MILGKVAGEGENATPSAGGQVVCVEAESSEQQTQVVPPACGPISSSIGEEHPVLESMSKMFQGKEHPILFESMAKLLTIQTEMLAAEAQVMGFFQLPHFSGENLQCEEDGFEYWIELFEECAGLGGWSKDQWLYQLGVHLHHMAHQVFCMMPEQEQKEYDTAVTVGITELKGIEFWQWMQLPEESVEQLGMQNLVRKGFRSPRDTSLITC